MIHLVTDAKGTVIHEVHVQMQELPLGMKALAPEVGHSGKPPQGQARPGLALGRGPGRNSTDLAISVVVVVVVVKKSFQPVSKEGEGAGGAGRAWHGFTLWAGDGQHVSLCPSPL